MAVHAGDHRNDGADGPEEMPEEHAEHAVLLEEVLAALHHLRVGAERPVAVDRVLEVEPDPIGHRVAERAADAGSEHDRPDVDVAGAEQAADGHEDHRRRHHQRDEGKALAEGQREGDGRRPGLMRLDEGDYRVDEIVHGFGWSFQSFADVVPVMAEALCGPARPGNGKGIVRGWISALHQALDRARFKPSCTAA